MNIVAIILSLLMAYLLGSLSTAVWTGKIFHGIDVREHGSGNAGATNVIRVLGWKTGVPVLIIDMAKGALAALLPVFLHTFPVDSSQLINIQIFCGLIAIAGHMFPVFAGFRGGKGVATAAGAIAAIHPPVTLICLGIFIVVFLITGIVSISSMTAGIAFPVLLLTLFDTPSVFFKIFSVFIAVALLITHRQNIKRLLKGEEKRLFKKKVKD